MITVGIRELKANLSRYLARVKRGEHVAISERGKPIATIVPEESNLGGRIEALLRSGAARWSGGKPRGLARPVKLNRGPSLAESILSDRR